MTASSINESSFVDLLRALAGLLVLGLGMSVTASSAIIDGGIELGE
jgi:hypothetical protein